MRRIIPLASMLLILASPSAASSISAHSPVLAAAALPLANLTVINGDASGKTRWVAWAELGPRQAVRLALVDRDGARTVVRGAIVHADAYEPLLRAIPQWTYGGHSLVAFTVSYGAGAQQVELIADDNGAPRVFASELGAAIGWTIAPTGAPILVIYTRVGSALQPRCRVWRESGDLAEIPCPPF
ncbi:hypothetical protein KZX46_02160 (plasmid) [Polymorphobacter sp. PAMC 29334]|uniref:hypothetical protein n=1 Tax=Polymorphobacter sp. PAMC 29334 TaxID=2862331 RepID=UPI001C74B0B1|nr:hypothetical protein [Polymorphobacter sp. PAMC 29334]QYE32977.1 hypothetical protein KZX46_02160 [Polymorphobacter sp. PAMC 29334]